LTLHTEYLHTEYVTVRSALLGLLSQGPRYGYELKTRFEEATGSVWPLNIGQVYTTLDRLERDGRVTVALRGDGQKVYDLKDEGRAELTGWFDDTGADEPPPRDDLLLKVLTIVASSPTDAVRVIGNHRSTLIDGLAKLRSLPPRDDLASNIVRDARMARIEAELIWLDRCEERLAISKMAERTERKR
jgi:DNA-binding PadR family transcriptional regulator